VTIRSVPAGSTRPGRALAIATLIVVGSVAGAVLALRFRVLSLVPAVGVGLVAILGLGIARGEGLGAIAVHMVVVATALQAGYLGIVCRRLTRAFRLGANVNNINNLACMTHAFPRDRPPIR